MNDKTNNPTIETEATPFEINKEVEQFKEEILAATTLEKLKTVYASVFKNKEGAAIVGRYTFDQLMEIYKAYGTKRKTFPKAAAENNETTANDAAKAASQTSPQSLVATEEKEMTPRNAAPQTSQKTPKLFNPKVAADEERPLLAKYEEEKPSKKRCFCF